MGFAVGVVKYLVFIVNLIFALFGLGIIIYGIVLNVQYKEDSSTVPIIFGIVVFIIAFFGCCGAIKESRCMLITFAVILIILFVISLIFGGLFVAAGFKNENCTEYRTEIYNKYRNATDKEDWMFIQAENECCGLEGPGDYNTSELPPSCCKGSKKVCTKDDPDLFPEGCLFECQIGRLLHVLGIVVIIIGLVEIIGSILTICLAKSVRGQTGKGAFV